MEGSAAAHVCTFARHFVADDKTQVAIVIAPRLLKKLSLQTDTLVPCGSNAWGDTVISLSRSPIAMDGDGQIRDAFTGQKHALHQGALSLADVLNDFPLALLIHDSVFEADEL